MFGLSCRERDIRRKEEKLWLKLDKKKREKQLKQGDDFMLSKPCPINKDLCSKNCIHFEQGHVWKWIESYHCRESKCKLWK